MTGDPSSFPSVDLETLRAVGGAWTTGVVVVTASHAGRDAGLLMVSLAPVSQDPPLVLWSVDRGSSSLATWLGAPGFALHLLAEDQEPLAWRFAQTGEGKFDGLALGRGAVGAPLLDGAVAVVECASHARHEAGDHVILVGRVVEAHFAARRPLVMHAGRMRGLPPDPQGVTR